MITKIKEWHKRIQDWDEKINREHPKVIWILIIIFSSLLSVVFFLISIPFGFFIILSVSTIQTLIEAEATILGFFGLMIVYLLTSYDNKIDKIEEKLDLADSNKVELLCNRLDKIRERKRKACNTILSALFSLIMSFFLSITAMGILNAYSEPAACALVVITIASTFLFIGISSLFVMVYRIGREPEVKKTKISVDFD
jgi:hypothetical protein